MTKFISTNYHQTIAYNKFKGKKTGIIFLSGFKSDMTGQKAITIENWARKKNHSFLRFDYSGHGQSSGDFNNLVFSDWLRDSVYIINHLTQGPQIIVGSSMGGWIGLNLIKHKSVNIKSIICLAAAPDFPKLLIWDRLSSSQKKNLIKDKKITLSKKYDGEEYKNTFTKDFLKDALFNSVMDRKLHFTGKVFLYHGMKDQDVPYQTSINIMNNIVGTNNIQLILEKNGKHRLSEKNELKTILKLLEQCN